MAKLGFIVKGVGKDALASAAGALFAGALVYVVRDLGVDTSSIPFDNLGTYVQEISQNAEIASEMIKNVYVTKVVGGVAGGIFFLERLGKRFGSGKKLYRLPHF